jgi:hypothetical protein
MSRKAKREFTPEEKLQILEKARQPKAHVGCLNSVAVSLLTLSPPGRSQAAFSAAVLVSVFG